MKRSAPLGAATLFAVMVGASLLWTSSAIAGDLEPASSVNAFESPTTSQMSHALVAMTSSIELPEDWEEDTATKRFSKANTLVREGTRGG